MGLYPFPQAICPTLSHSLVQPTLWAILADTPQRPQYNPGMDSGIDKAQWLKTYRQTTEMLEVIRARELVALTDEEVWRRIKSLKVVGKPWRERPDWSGLVEQQELFHRGRKRQ